MSSSVFTRKFELPKPNWWLWICLALPQAVYLLLRPYDHLGGAGFAISDWDWILFYVQGFGYGQFFLHGAFWGAVVDALVHSFLGPLVIAWGVQQSIISLGRRFGRRASSE
jgi:hypothetical protein